MLMGIIALTVFASCQKENLTADSSEQTCGSLIIEAENEQQVSDNLTKTTLDENKDVLWQVNDLIKVFGTVAGEPASIKMKATAVSADGKTATFTEVGTDLQGFTPLCAIYPYSDGATYNSSSNKINFTAPKQQGFVENSFGRDANISIAQYAGGKLSFKNAFGVLKFSLVGNGTVERVVLTGLENDGITACDLCGEMSATVAAEPVITIAGGQTDNKELVLDCGEGVDLSMVNPTTFYLVVPAGSFGGGFTVQAWCGEYNHSEEITASHALISRSVIKAMKGTKEAFIIPEEYRQAYALKGDGIAYIIGPDVKMEDITAEIDFKVCSVKDVNSGALFGVGVDYQCTLMKYGNSCGVPSSVDKIRVSSLSSNKILINSTVQLNENYKAVLHKKDGSLNIGTLDGSVVASGTPVSASGSLRPWIMARNYPDHSSLPSSDVIVRVKYYNYGDTEEKATHLLYPAQKLTDGEYGLYDVISGDFYTNCAGNGAFSETGQMKEVQYFESNGTQYVKGPALTAPATVVFDYQLLSSAYSLEKFKCILAIQDGTGNSANFFPQFIYGKVSDAETGIRGSYSGNAMFDKNTVALDTVWHTAVLNDIDGEGNVLCSIDGITTVKHPIASLPAYDGLTLSVFGRYNGILCSAVRIKSIKIYSLGADRTTSTPLYSLIPMTNGSVFAYYDEIGINCYYSNAPLGCGPLVP